MSGESEKTLRDTFEEAKVGSIQLRDYNLLILGSALHLVYFL